MNRRFDWRTRLEAVISGATSRPFEWGTWDCFCFASECVVVQLESDLDIALPYRGTYDSEEGAKATIASSGFRDVPEYVASILPEIHPSQARKGDVVAVRVGRDDWALGVCLGEHIGVLREDGYGTLARSHAHRAFGVGWEERTPERTHAPQRAPVRRMRPRGR